MPVGELPRDPFRIQSKAPLAATLEEIDFRVKEAWYEVKRFVTRKLEKRTIAGPEKKSANHMVRHGSALSEGYF